MLNSTFVQSHVIMKFDLPTLMMTLESFHALLRQFPLSMEVNVLFEVSWPFDGASYKKSLRSYLKKYMVKMSIAYEDQT